MSTRWWGRGGQGKTDLNCTGKHVELSGELFAKGSVWLCIFSEDVFENLELGSRGSLAVFDFVWDVGKEGPEIDRGGVDSGRHQRGNASSLIP